MDISPRNIRQDKCSFWNDMGSRGTGASQPMPPPNGDPMMKPVDGGASNGQIPVGSGRGKEDWRSHVRVTSSCNLSTWKRHRRREKEPVIIGTGVARRPWFMGRYERVMRATARASASDRIQE